MSVLTELATGGNRLPALAGEIEAAHQRCKAGVREALDAALAAGRARRIQGGGRGMNAPVPDLCGALADPGIYPYRSGRCRP